MHKTSPSSSISLDPRPHASPCPVDRSQTPSGTATAVFTVGFILSTRRAGSTWLGAVLGSHPQTASLGEYFRPFKDRSHVACRLCEADGLPECRVLHGIKQVPVEDAFAFAHKRTGKHILIDCSKMLDWPLPFLPRVDMNARFIHLVRHPCGYIESEMRRRPGLDPTLLIDEWITDNRNIEAFIAHTGKPVFLASYERLADDPAASFPPLCDFLGFPFDPAALRYWTLEHHGLGGNGANSLYLKNRKVARYVTGDDAYYADAESRPLAADVRWRDRLPPSLCAAAISTDYARQMATRLGIQW